MREVRLHVAADGRDAAAGTESEPFATLKGARDALRALRGQGGDASRQPATVAVRGGVYHLEEPLWLGPQDSGARGAPVRWQAAADEQVILNGGVQLADWQPWQGRVLRAPLPERAAWHGNGRPRQLFYRGVRQRRSRWPKHDPRNPLTGGWIIPEGEVPEHEYQALRWPPGAFPRRWERVREAEANIYAGWGWCNTLIPILEIDHERRELRLARTPMRQDEQQWYFDMRLGPWNRFYVENVLEEVTEPGDWCCDLREGMVYFLPPAADFDPAQVRMPVTDCLVRLHGAAWVSLEGFTFTCTTTGDAYHRQGVLGLGAMVNQQGWQYCGEAVHLRGTRHCTVERCRFDQVGGNAVYVERDNYRAAIRRNHIDRAGLNGVVLAGDLVKHPRFCQVVDNHIHDIGRLINYVAGVFLGISDSNRIAHNHIHDVPHHAVNLGSNGLGRNYVEWNEIRRACLEIADTGAINSWMDVPFPWVEPQAQRSGHFIRYNLIADTRGCRVHDGRVIADPEQSRGIYLDDYTSNCTVWGNIILRSGTGMVFHGGRHNVAENNIIVGCQCQLSVYDGVNDRPGHQPLAGWNVGNRFCCNVCVLDRPGAVILRLDASRPEKLPYQDAFIGQMDRNVYYSDRGEYLCVVSKLEDDTGEIRRQPAPYRERQLEGFDADCLFADPLFVDPSQDDYRLSPQSPAWQLGFTPIDVERIGIRPDRPR